MTENGSSSLPAQHTAPIGPHTMHRFTLSNGISLIVQENHASPSVVIRGHLWAGSATDTLDKLGVARFTANTIAHGTHTRSFYDINEETESIGAGIFFSGGRHLTAMGGKALAEDFDLLVDILSDILLNPTFPQEQVEKVRGQIITALKESENDTRSMASRDFRKILYTWDYPYGRPGDGTLESVPTITRDDLVEFYQSQYRPEGAVLIVVGDVRAEAVYQILEQKLGHWRPMPHHASSIVPPIQPPDELRRSLRPMDNKTQVDIVLGCIGPVRKAADFYAARVGNVILGQLGLMGRLGQNVRDKQGLAYYASSRLEGGLGPGPWNVRVGVNPDKVEQAIDAVLTEFTKLGDEPVSDEEYADSLDYLTGTLPLRLETNEGIANTLNDIEVFDLGDDYIMRYPSLIRSVTKSDIQSTARKYLNPEHYAVAIAGPYSE